MAEEICQFFEQLKTLVHQAERRNTSDKVELNDLRVKIGIGIATVADLLDNVESTASKMQIRSLMDCLELILLEIVRELQEITRQLHSLIIRQELVYSIAPGRPKCYIADRYNVVCVAVDSSQEGE